MTKEKLIHHLEALREKHAKIDQEVDLMESTGHFVDHDLNVLKKQRLILRDEIETTTTLIEQYGNKVSG